ncbi:MAG TPA: hypothetical protein VKE94_10125, partial [Gemmataceae bacterium]|nr:hypothetical protein [Gemmataceae bacterium]
MGHRRLHGWLGGLVFVALAAGWALPARAQELVRVTRNVAGEAKPLDVAADEVSTWMEDGKLVVMARGNVLLQMGVFHARFSEGIVWIDVARQKATRILHADVYAEGELRVENGTDVKRGVKGLLDLSTRGTLEVKSIKTRATAVVRRDDPLYQRALTQRPTAPAAPVAGQPKANPSPIQRTGYQSNQPPSQTPAVPPPDPPPG